MAWWDDVADAVADVVEAVVNGAGEAVADTVETVGNGAQDALEWLAGEQPFVGDAAAWLGDVVAGATNLVGAVVKGATGIAGGALAGAVRILAGLLTLDGDLFRRGLLDVLASVGGAVVLVAGQLLSLVQRALFLQSNDRPLSAAEKQTLRRVFHNSLALYNIRVIEGWSGLFGVVPNAFTLGNTIYLKDVRSPSVLVHEAVHVWQYQTVGARYTVDALGAQAWYGTDPVGGAYDWHAELDRGRERWWEFNEEAQAEFVQDVWDRGTLTVLRRDERRGRGAFYMLGEVLGMFGPGSATARFGDDTDGDGVLDVDRTAFAQESVDALRMRINPRWSHAF